MCRKLIVVTVVLNDDRLGEEGVFYLSGAAGLSMLANVRHRRTVLGAMSEE